MRPYRLLTPASRDLTEILEYLYTNSAAAADRFLTSLDRRLDLLANQPYTGHRRKEFGQDDLRYITFGAYIIAYYPETKPLVIAALVHGSRDLSAHLKEHR